MAGTRMYVGVTERTARLLAGRYLQIGEPSRESGLDIVDAHDLSLDRRVSLRIAGSSRASDRSCAAANVAHANVEPIVDSGTLRDGRQFFVVHPRTGETIDEHVVTHGRFSARDAADIAVQILGALAAAHDAGVAHGALTASCIVLTVRRGCAPFVTVRHFGVRDLEGADFETARRADMAAVISILREYVFGELVSVLRAAAREPHLTAFELSCRLAAQPQGRAAVSQPAESITRIFVQRAACG